MQQGMQAKSVEIAKNMLSKLHLAMQTIAQATVLNQEERMKLQEKGKQQEDRIPKHAPQGADQPFTKKSLLIQTPGDHPLQGIAKTEKRCSKRHLVPTKREQ
jgi:hypothetical protein